jgi:hypothetical protein
MFAAVPGSGANFLTGLDVRLGHSWNPEKDNLGPEVGFAWSPAILHDRLVVRGGYGLNYNQEEIALSSNIFANPGLTVFPTFVMSTPSSPNQIGGGNNWGVNGWGNYNAMLAELKHQFAQQFTLDAQFAWAKSMDTSSGPYFEQPYPYDLNLDYGRSDYNVGKAFKLFGVWQPVFFHGDRAWVEKIAGGWSLSGILNVHSGFPWSPVVNFGGSLYCGTCGYSTLFPAAYLAHPGNSTSNYAFKSGANYPNGAEA